MSARYLIAKFAPDVARMEPRNIGVILWADGQIASRFLPSADAEFVSEKPIYDRWLAFWNRVIAERSVANGKVITADDPAFLDAMMKTQEGNFLLLNGGRVLDEIGHNEVKSATDFLFGQLVAPVPETYAEAEDKLSHIADAIFEETGARDRSDWKGSTTVKCWVKEVQQDFPFSYVFGTDRRTHAVFQRVPIGRRQSVNNAAFMMEWVGETKVVKAKSRRGAIIDTSVDQPTKQQSIEMLGQFSTIIDIADKQLAAKKITKALDRIMLA